MTRAMGIALTLWLTAAVTVTGEARDAAAVSAPPLDAGVATFDSLLIVYARDGAVDYDGLSRDRAGLRRYVDGLAAASPSTTHAPRSDDALAFYINAYNACTLDLIVRLLDGPNGEGPRLTGIKDIPDAWNRFHWVIAGDSLSLNQIEHDILRKRLAEPRVHFALVCASRSCPALPSRAYHAKRIERELDDAARAFLLDSSRNDFTVRDGGIQISRIFDWYGEDFARAGSETPLEKLYGRKIGAVLDFVSRYLPAEIMRPLLASRVEIRYLDYDWSLNARKPR